MRKRRTGLQFIERWRDRHGKMRFYFRRDRRKGSPRIKLDGVFGSEEFNASYAAALYGTIESDDRAKIERPGNGTLAALSASYKQDAAFKGLRDTTKAGYLSRLDAIQREHGGRSVSGLNQERIETMLAAYNDRSASKLDTLKKLRILIKHAMKKKWISGDPSTGIKRTKVGEVRSFTDDEIRQYETTSITAPSNAPPLPCCCTT